MGDESPEEGKLGIEEGEAEAEAEAQSPQAHATPTPPHPQAPDAPVRMRHLP